MKGRSPRSDRGEEAYVGVRFGDETLLTLCLSAGFSLELGEAVIVEMETGPAYGKVEKLPMTVFRPCQKTTARRVLRTATEGDTRAYGWKREREEAAAVFCRERARQVGLEIKVSRAVFSLDGRQAVFYFIAEGRVDFRQLVRDLSRRFGVRVRMVQVGARDESRLLGGVGVCGRTLCCSSMLREFKPISIQMAKRQNLSLNPSKISGQCGRLLCCLAYEDEQYRKRNGRPVARGEREAS